MTIVTTIDKNTHNLAIMNDSFLPCYNFTCQKIWTEIEIFLMALKQIGMFSHHIFPKENVCFDLNDVCQKLKEAVSRGMTFTFSHFPTQILQTDPHSPLKAPRENCLSQHHLAHTEVKMGNKKNLSFLQLFTSPLADTHTDTFSKKTNKQKKNTKEEFPSLLPHGKFLM